LLFPMKIYTKTGDKGETSLIGGTRVPKFHVRIDACGTVDELISYIGLIRDQEIGIETKKVLIAIQDRLMTCVSILVTECENCETTVPELHENDIRKLEDEIDRMEQNLTPLDSFILPGGHPIVSYCYITGNICRRAERNSLKIGADIKGAEMVHKYLNRLSDYLFVLARHLAKELDIEEIRWKPRG